MIESSLSLSARARITLTLAHNHKHAYTYLRTHIQIPTVYIPVDSCIYESVVFLLRQTPVPYPAQLVYQAAGMQNPTKHCHSFEMLHLIRGARRRATYEAVYAKVQGTQSHLGLWQFLSIEVNKDKQAAEVVSRKKRCYTLRVTHSLTQR